MIATYTVVLAISAFLFALVGTWALVNLLPKWSVMDLPGERSNHAAPVPRGGGLAVIAAGLFFLLVSGIDSKLLFAMLLVATVSFADDIRSRSVRVRLLAQTIAALLAVYTIHEPIFHAGLPDWLDRLLAVPLLLWFMNLYNFMDGIDEISAMETVSLGLGLCAMVWVANDLPGFLAADGMTLAGAACGFWCFNRHPAKIFLGDVGSIPLGLVLGFLLLVLASQGYWPAALILPAYYLVDATTTLLGRLLRRERIFEAHSQHAYQRAARGGVPQPVIVRYILALNLLLIVLAAVSTLGSLAATIALAAAYLLTFALILLFRRQSRPVPPTARNLAVTDA